MARAWPLNRRQPRKNSSISTLPPAAAKVSAGSTAHAKAECLIAYSKNPETVGHSLSGGGLGLGHKTHKKHRTSSNQVPVGSVIRPGRQAAKQPVCQLDTSYLNILREHIISLYVYNVYNIYIYYIHISIERERDIVECYSTLWVETIQT